MTATSEAKTIVWWHFADLEATGASSVWNEAGRAALREAGCPLDEPRLEPSRLAEACKRPLRHARDRVLLVRPTLLNGEATIDGLPVKFNFSRPQMLQVEEDELIAA